MKHRTQSLKTAIEKNRIALLRMVFCWLALALCASRSGDRPLPRRLAGWIEELISKAEKASAYLLIAIFYNGQIYKRHSPAFEKAAHLLLAKNRTTTLGTLTLSGIIKRLKALQQTLYNLHKIARRLAKNIAARARITLMKSAIFGCVPDQQTAVICLLPSKPAEVPP